MSQHPPVHHPKNLILGFHGWDAVVPKEAIYMVNSFSFLLGLFFLHTFFFSSLFFLRASISKKIWGPPLTSYYFLVTPTYPSNLPTTLPPSNPSTSLLLLFFTSFPPFPLTSIPNDKDNLSLH